jgi:ribosome maturation factor RimP
MNIAQLKPLIMAKVEETGYIPYGIEFVKEQKNDILRVYIDSEKDIVVDDCQIVSQVLSTYLDEIDPIPTEYYLEVSSPGAERELRTDKDIFKAKGKYIHLETFEQTLEGVLFEVYPESIIIQIKGKNISVSKIDIQKIRLAIKF